MDNEKIDLTGLYLTEDIEIANIETESEGAFERYEYTENIDEFLEWVQEYSKKATEDEKATAKSFSQVFPASLGDVREWISEGHHADVYDEWRDNIGLDEQYSVPMMNALRYFPSFVTFTDEERFKVSSNTCLLYDVERDQWAVGMTGGGMDLSPHLLATFILLRKRIPLELAWSIRANYAAYVKNETHVKNCAILAAAFESYAQSCTNQAQLLRIEVRPIV